MKILLIIPNYGNKQTYFMPLGLLYISSYLKSLGYEVHCLNLNHYPKEKLKETLCYESFDVIGTGGLFIHISPIRFIIQTARRCSPKSKVILGGAIASADTEFILNEVKPDYCVIGEGEHTFGYLLEALQNDSDPRQVTGLAFKENGLIVQTPPTPLVKDLNTLPYPDYEGFEYEHFLKNFSENKRIGYIISTRDCTSKCTFCFRIMGGSYRVRSIDNLLGEIRYLINRYNINELILMDDMFSAHRDRIVEFCRAIKPLNIPWECQFRVTSVDDGLLGIMKDAGCHIVGYGFESGSPKVLKSMKKGINLQQIERAIRGNIKAKLTLQANFIFGDPVETCETMKETINFTRKFQNISMGYGFIIPYPGTKLYYKLIREEKLKDRLKFHEDPGHKIYNMTSLSDIDFLYMWRRVKVENYLRKQKCLGKILKLKKIKKNYYSVNIRCHLCQGVNEDFLFSHSNCVVCKHCYQRTFIDLTDIRFLRFDKIIYKLYYIYIMRVITLTPQVHRILCPIASLAKMLRNILKGK